MWRACLFLASCAQDGVLPQNGVLPQLPSFGVLPEVEPFSSSVSTEPPYPEEESCLASKPGRSCGQDRPEEEEPHVIQKKTKKKLKKAATYIESRTLSSWKGAIKLMSSLPEHSLKEKKKIQNGEEDEQQVLTKMKTMLPSIFGESGARTPTVDLDKISVDSWKWETL